GKHIAYVGFDDRRHGYQVTRLYVMSRDGRGKRCLTEKFDRDAVNPVWDADGQGVLFHFDDEGVTKVGRVSLEGKVEVRAEDVGGTPLDRPYASGSFTLARDGTVAFTQTGPGHPAEVAVCRDGAKARQLTSLSTDFLGHKVLGKVEEVRWKSGHDGRP